jgi:hypothetical protein
MPKKSQRNSASTMVRPGSDVFNQPSLWVARHPAFGNITSTLPNRRHIQAHASAYFLQGFAGTCSRFTRGKSAERRSRDAIHFSYEELRRVPPRLRLSKGESPRECQGLRLG